MDRAALSAIPQFQCLVLAANFLKQPFGAFNAHHHVFHAMGDQRRARDVARDSLEVEILQALDPTVTP